jgi:hypothetical protein
MKKRFIKEINMNKTLEEILIGIEEIATEMAKNENYPNETRQGMFKRIESLCDFYMKADSSGREEIRQYILSINGAIKLPFLFYVVPNAMYAFINYAADNIKSVNDAKWFDYGLTAASIEEGILDSRDLVVGLGHLNEKAKKAGINTKEHIKSIMEISTLKVVEIFKMLGR